MARQEQDREDLLREARALVHRGEFCLADFPEPVVIGFRQNGAPSIFVGQDPALHFTTDNHLRRGYVDGLLLKAMGGRLIQMRRVRAQGEVQLRSTPLTDPQQAALLVRVADWLSRVAQALQSGRFELAGAVPEQADLTAEATDWLLRIGAQPLVVAAAPGVA
jgi:hypothetical protein